MRPESKNFLTEILRAARDIRLFTSEKSVGNFGENELVRAGVYMKFVIIGEMLSRVREVDEPTFQSISESSRIVGFRHQIAHGYGEMDDAITRRVIINKLPLLIAEVESLLAS